MAIYPPPTFLEEIPIFNTINWETSAEDTIDIAYLNANYLRFPVAQGFETLQEISVNGNANFNNPVFVNDNITLEQGITESKIDEVLDIGLRVTESISK